MSMWERFLVLFIKICEREGNMFCFHMTVKLVNNDRSSLQIVLTNVSDKLISFASWALVTYFLFNFIHLFLAALGLHCCLRAFSRCGERELLSSCAQAPRGGGFSCWQSTCSGACRLQYECGFSGVAHGPSCPVACAVLPDEVSNPCPLHWQVDSQPLDQQGSPVTLSFCHWIFLCLLCFSFMFFSHDIYQDILILSELTSDDFLKNGIYNSSGMMYWVFIFTDHLKNQNTAPADWIIKL